MKTPDEIARAVAALPLPERLQAAELILDALLFEDAVCVFNVDEATLDSAQSVAINGNSVQITVSNLE